jgi:hypothetical protein
LWWQPKSPPPPSPPNASQSAVTAIPLIIANLTTYLHKVHKKGNIIFAWNDAKMVTKIKSIHPILKSQKHAKYGLPFLYTLPYTIVPRRTSLRSNKNFLSKFQIFIEISLWIKKTYAYGPKGQCQLFIKKWN